MVMRRYLPRFIADSFFSMLYFAAVMASFPAIVYSNNLPAFLGVTISIEQVREKDYYSEGHIISCILLLGQSVYEELLIHT